MQQLASLLGWICSADPALRIQALAARRLSGSGRRRRSWRCTTSRRMSPGAAAKKATTDLVGKYRFVEQSGFLQTEDGRTPDRPVYRVPAEA